MRSIAASIVFVALAARPVSAADPLSSLHFLVGTWNCTYSTGKATVYYKATYTFDLRNNWLRVNDAWSGGGNDLGMITYEPHRRGFTAVIMDDQRATVVFHANGSNPDTIVYHSVFPNAMLTDVFQRDSPTRYRLHFTQTAGHRSLRSTDVCVKK